MTFIVSLMLYNSNAHEVEFLVGQPCGEQPSVPPSFKLSTAFLTKKNRHKASSGAWNDDILMRLAS